MKFRKRPAVLLACLLSFAILFSGTAFAATVTYKTQKEYDTADIAWLRDLIIKESMEVSSDVGEKVTLIARPEYPYATTAADFKAEVAQYCELYTLNENAPRVAYIYLFELMNANSGLFTGQADDDTVLNYLENIGIAMPAAASADEMVLARALYAAMVTGTFTAVSSEELGKGIAFEKAMVTYLTSLSGLSESELLKWAPEGGVTSFDDYVLAASRLTLWSNGYDVSVDTPESEVYRLTAVLTLRKMGINVGTDASFEALKAKYTAALLGKQYGVNVEPDRLTAARESGTEAFYILQLLGKKADLVVGDSLTFEEAFDRVAGKTDAFALESGAFYADIYKYEVRLSQIRSSLWLFPVAYLTGQEDAEIDVSVNGAYLPNNTYSEISINPNVGEQTLEIKVRASIGGKSSERIYTITVLQGKKAAAAQSRDGNAAPESSSSIIANILASLGADESVAALMDGIYDTLPDTVKNVMSFIAPTFESFSASASPQPAKTPAADTQSPGTEETEAATAAPETIQTKLQNSYFVYALDKIGRIIDFVIYGIDGVDLNAKYESRTVDHNFITFE